MREQSEGILARFTAWLTREPEFACGDCERWRNCGLPPTEDCLMRGEAIIRSREQRQLRNLIAASKMSRTM